MTNFPPIPNAAELLSSCKIIASPRRKRIGAVIRSDGTVEIRIPQQLPLAQLHQAAAELAPWIVRKKAEIERKCASGALPKHHQFEIGEHFYFRGQAYELQFIPSPVGSRLIALRNGTLQSPLSEPAEIHKELIRFYERQAFFYLPERTRVLAENFQVAIRNVKINAARGRYGSCAADGRVNFSWHLMMYPDELIDFVIAHELAHRTEMNHSAAFYRVLRHYVPQCDACRKALIAWSRKIGSF